MGKGSKSQTTTQTTSIPDYIQDPQKAYLAAAGQMVAPFLQTPNNWVAGLNADHTAAMDMTRQAAAGQFAPGANYADRIGAINYSPDIAGYGAAANVGRDQIAQQMNPYTEMVAGRAMDNMRDQYGRAASDMASRYAASGAFGGSREAVSRANMASDYSKNAGDLYTQLLSGSFDRAQGMASDNANRQMQAVQGANAARLGQANMQLQALQGADAATQAAFQRQLQGATSVAGVGDTLRGVEQQGLNVPRDALSFYAGLVPGVYPQSSSTTQPLHNNTMSGILGAGLAFSGLFG
jgi:hypothetical protein